MKLINLICFVLAAHVLIAEEPPKQKLTEKQRAERRAMMAAKRAERIAAAGGIVTRPLQGNAARIVSAQKRIPRDLIDSIVTQFNTGLSMQIEVSAMERESDIWKTIKKAQSLPNTGLVTIIVDDPKLPRILSALEDGWSVLNVNGLDEDMPPKEVYENRIRKEINRAFAQAAGAGLSLNRPCVMESAYTLHELDKIQFPVISPEAMSKIQEAGNKKKIGRIVRKTYLKACQEGWAPAPTNDIQRAIWEKVHSIPDKPLTIEFDPKKDK